ncbi:MAG: DUF2341 domain-containing protein [Fibrobacteria bacterium]
MQRKFHHPSGMARLLSAPLLACAFLLPQCQSDPSAPKTENYVTVRLNDSLKRYDSVYIAIVLTADTGVTIGRIWGDSLPDPAAIPSYPLPEGESRDLSIRVRGFDSTGLAMDMLIIANAGVRTVRDLPVPVRPGPGGLDSVPGTDPPPDPVVIGNDSAHGSGFDFTPWKYKRRIDIKIASLGMGKGNMVRDFPLLVRLDKGNFTFNQAAASGQDLRFADRGGSDLPYEIALWEADSGQSRADIWVRLDSLATDDDSAGIWMYWGNASATAASDGSKVFDSGSGFGSVLHLSEQAKGVSGEFKDAMGRFAGTGGTGDGKALTNRIDGVVGYGQDFQTSFLEEIPGKGEVVSTTQGTISLPPDFDAGRESWTFQAWVQRSGNENGIIFQKGDDGTESRERFKIRCYGGAWGTIRIERAGLGVTTNLQLPIDKFVQLGLSYTGSKVTFYLDGLPKDSLDWTQGPYSQGRNVIGASYANGQEGGFNGAMDEIWFASIPRSPEWMRLSFENQKPGSTIVALRPL